jgi:hypothetical protein
MNADRFAALAKVKTSKAEFALASKSDNTQNSDPQNRDDQDDLKLRHTVSNHDRLRETLNLCKVSFVFTLLQ